ncbi:MAG: NAD(P)H-hydrate dehydratase [Anaerolineae bacterium]
MLKVVTTQQMRDIEKAADAGGLSYATMMENAGRAVALATQRYIGDVDGKKIFVLVGPGNNGGDGLVAARYLHQEGAHAVLYIWKREPEGDENFRLAQEQKIPLVWAEEDAKLTKLRNLLRQADAIIDALLGTGVSRPIKGTLKEILEAVQKEVDKRGEARYRMPEAEGFSTLQPVPDIPQIETPAQASIPSLPIIAVDVPSGLNCDTGNVDPTTMPADLTVTFGFPKVGQFLFPGAEYVGQLIVADIDIPPQLAAEVEIELATAESIKGLLPKRPLGAHKGTFGKALVVAGSVNYTGAAYLAGAAATRVGTGLVTMALARSLYPPLAAKLSESTFLLLPEDMGIIVPEAIELLDETWPDYQALLLGPGLGRERKTVEFVQRFLSVEPLARRAPIGFLAATEEVTKRDRTLPPMVIDADGLNALADTPEWWSRLNCAVVLTPHPGEMARLAGLSVAEVKADRLGVAQRMAAQWGQVVVLKGAYTLIAAEGRTVINPFANPGLATAGSGDVLAGAIVGFLAQGLGPWAAAVVGAYVHCLAGELVRAKMGARGMVAGDLLAALPAALRLIEQN